MVLMLAVGPPWWIDVQQLHSVASYPTSRSVIIRRRVDQNDVQLARTLHSLVCQGMEYYKKHRVSKNCAKLFLSELGQTLSNFNEL